MSVADRLHVFQEVKYLLSLGERYFLSITFIV